MPKIEIFTQYGCPYCVRAVVLLKEKGANFTEINAPHGSVEREESIRRSGGKRTVPQIFIDNVSLGGCDDLMQLEREGKLDALLRGKQN
ncbi:glutaredoxin 3 [Aristophania vespae]|uniref:Glutaredoxin n=1 Tax=Aristophania vespae TaxID=2697033 RepID=A0A6P1NBD0_9PROT|nr:glutaredoxin 3 [Aristophania vespae]QHI95676.1 glutaredoxin 3 [Aristophania vespae]UMM63362.1 Glutaredoxin 3 [Aristophania vespae]